MAEFLAIAQCRVSTLEQKEAGNSLEAQEKYIYECAEKLDAKIVKMWSLNVSSRKGKNLARKDLQEIFQYCKEYKNIRYYILDEVDRFMRSVEEYYWWKVEFKRIGVYLAYAKLPELTHQDDPLAVMREMLEVFRAEASNHERITKTKDKMAARAAAGYYPSNPRQGYVRGTIPALHVPDHRLERFNLLKQALTATAHFKMKPEEALRWLNENGYRTPGGCKLDMNHWRSIMLDPYYAGIIKFGQCPINENGLHEAMITKAEWEINVAIITKRPTNRRGQFNPNYPLNKYIVHKDCDKGDTNKFSGFNHSNGKGWERSDYSCRGCSICLSRDDIHDHLSAVLDAMVFIGGSKDRLKKSLKIAWQDEEKYRFDKLERLNKLKLGQEEVKSKVISAIVSNPDMADDLKTELNKTKAKIAEYEAQITEAGQVDKEFRDFTLFALDFVDNLRQNFWRLEPEDFIACLKLLFPEAIEVDSGKKLHISRISPLYILNSVTKNLKIVQFDTKSGMMVTPAGFEPAIAGLRTRSPGPLDEGATCFSMAY